MSFLDRYDKVTDPAKAVGRGTPGQIDRVLAFLDPDPARVLLAQAGGATAAAGGSATSGNVILSGSYRFDGKKTFFTVRLGKERKPANGSRRFGTYYRARAEAAASTKTAVITNDLRVFETDQARGFLPPHRTEEQGGGLAVSIRSIHNHEGRDETYANLVEQMRTTSDNAEKAKRVGRILELFFECEPSDLHVALRDDYVPDKLNVDVLVIGIGGITRFITPEEPEEGQPKLTFERGQFTPKVAFSVTHVFFDPRTPLWVWNSIVHEEQHARFKRRAVAVLRHFQGLPETKQTADFLTWLATQRKAKTPIAGAPVSDEDWIVLQEQGDLIRYVDVDGKPLVDNVFAECLCYLEGFKATFHNYDLADFKNTDGTFPTVPLFNDIKGTERYWTPSYWDNQVKGMSARLIRRWTSHIGKLDAKHRDAVRAYLAAAPESANNGFHKALKAALKI